MPLPLCNMHDDEAVCLSALLVDRLVELGVSHVFGVPGDYELSFLDEIMRRDPQQIQFVGTCNELNAAYAAEAYAKVKGVGALVTTHGVGELSALNGVAGAYAERVPLVHIVGCPGTELLEQGRPMHHCLPAARDEDKADIRTVFRAVSHFACAATILDDPSSAVAEIDRVLHACVSQQRPVMLYLPRDMAEVEIPLRKEEEVVEEEKSIKEMEVMRLSEENIEDRGKREKMAGKDEEEGKVETENRNEQQPEEEEDEEDETDEDEDELQMREEQEKEDEVEERKEQEDEIEDTGQRLRRCAMETDEKERAAAKREEEEADAEQRQWHVRQAARAIGRALRSALRPVLLVDQGVKRHGAQAAVRAWIGETGLPFVSCPMGKCVIDESLPSFRGVYVGAASEEEPRRLVDRADLLIGLGLVETDFNTGFFTARHPDIILTGDTTVVGHKADSQPRHAIHVIRGTPMREVITRLCGKKHGKGWVGAVRPGRLGTAHAQLPPRVPRRRVSLLHTGKRLVQIRSAHNLQGTPPSVASAGWPEPAQPALLAARQHSVQDMHDSAAQALLKERENEREAERGRGGGGKEEGAKERDAGTGRQTALKAEESDEGQGRKSDTPSSEYLEDMVAERKESGVLTRAGTLQKTRDAERQQTGRGVVGRVSYSGEVAEGSGRAAPSDQYSEELARERKEAGKLGKEMAERTDSREKESAKRDAESVTLPIRHRAAGQQRAGVGDLERKGGEDAKHEQPSERGREDKGSENREEAEMKGEEREMGMKMEERRQEGKDERVSMQKPELQPEHSHHVTTAIGKVEDKPEPEAAEVEKEKKEESETDSLSRGVSGARMIRLERLLRKGVPLSMSEMERQQRRAKEKEEQSKVQKAISPTLGALPPASPLPSPAMLLPPLSRPYPLSRVPLSSVTPGRRVTFELEKKAAQLRHKKEVEKREAENEGKEEEAESTEESSIAAASKEGGKAEEEEATANKKEDAASIKCTQPYKDEWADSPIVTASRPVTSVLSASLLESPPCVMSSAPPSPTRPKLPPKSPALHPAPEPPIPPSPFPETPRQIPASQPASMRASLLHTQTVSPLQPMPPAAPSPPSAQIPPLPPARRRMLLSAPPRATHAPRSASALSSQWRPPSPASTASESPAPPSEDGRASEEEAPLEIPPRRIGVVTTTSALADNASLPVTGLPSFPVSTPAGTVPLPAQANQSMASPPVPAPPPARLPVLSAAPPPPIFSALSSAAAAPLPAAQPALPLPPGTQAFAAATPFASPVPAPLPAPPAPALARAPPPAPARVPVTAPFQSICTPVSVTLPSAAPLMPLPSSIPAAAAAPSAPSVLSAPFVPSVLPSPPPFTPSPDSVSSTLPLSSPVSYIPGTVTATLRAPASQSLAASLVPPSAPPPSAMTPSPPPLTSASQPSLSLAPESVMLDGLTKDDGAIASAHAERGRLSLDFFFTCLHQIIPAHNLIVSDVGATLFKLLEMTLPDDTLFLAQVRWLSLGHALPNLLGASLADPTRKPFAFIGDGGFQFTAQELSTIMKYQIPALICVVNNGGYLSEKALHTDNAYNKIVPWRYEKLAQAFGDNCETMRVSSEEEAREFVRVMTARDGIERASQRREEGSGSGCARGGERKRQRGPMLVEVVVSEDDTPKLMQRAMALGKKAK